MPTIVYFPLETVCNFNDKLIYDFQSTTYRGKYGLPRGVTGRRAAIKWLLKRTSSKTRGILYFADDDNTYDLRLFNELLKIDSHHGVGMFPVGMAPPFLIPIKPVIRVKAVVGGRGCGGHTRLILTYSDII